MTSCSMEDLRDSQIVGIAQYSVSVFYPKQIIKSQGSPKRMRWSGMTGARNRARELKPANLTGFGD